MGMAQSPETWWKIPFYLEGALQNAELDTKKVKVVYSESDPKKQK